MSDPILEKASGTWTGTNSLWLDPTAEPEVSDTGVSVSPEKLEYTWAFRGKPQTGAMVFTRDSAELRADWTDTFHSKDAMHCRGQQDTERLSVVGSYPAGDGPDWSWRTEVSLRSADELLVQMFNITPQGEESLAVTMECKRA